MNRPIIVEAITPPVGKCAVCNYSGRDLPFHDIELGWICKGCIHATVFADHCLNRLPEMTGLRRPPPIDFCKP